MARDLIPPSSPAGRPAPDGTPNLIELPPEPPRSASQPAMHEPVGPSQFRNRFGFLLGALAGIFIAAALAGVVVLSAGDEDPAGAGLAPNWSSWQPSDTSLAGGAAQIAKKVSAEYRDANGKQLVVVQGAPLEATVALRGSSGVTDLIDGPGVAYTMDGLGPNKSIPGAGSEQRFQLVQREALELALYTFRYLPEVHQVVTYLPPPPPTDEQITADAKAKAAAMMADAAITQAQKTGEQKDLVAAQAAIALANKTATETVPDRSRRAIFYRPEDLRPQLEKPLGATLPAKLATPGSLSEAEVSEITKLTTFNLFAWSNPDPARAILMLDR